MSRTLPAWTIAGISLAVAAGCIHALTEYILDQRTWGTLGQRTDTLPADGFGPDGYGPVNRCA